MTPARIQAIALTVWRGILRRKDAYVLLVLGGGLVGALVSLNIFGLGGTARYVLDAGLLLAWLFSGILAVNLGGRELPGEESSGTVFALLAKPLTRAELVVGKWLGVTASVAAATLVFYAIVLGMTVARGGRVGMPALAQAFALHAVAIGILAALALMFSTRLNHDAAASLAAIAAVTSFAVVPQVPAFVVSEPGAKAFALLLLYHALPHLDVLDMRRRVVHDFGPVDASGFLMAAAYGVLITAVLLLLAWWGYRRKRFLRANLM